MAEKDLCGLHIILSFFVQTGHVRFLAIQNLMNDGCKVGPFSPANIVWNLNSPSGYPGLNQYDPQSTGLLDGRDETEFQNTVAIRINEVQK